jgi:hypothetical protein
MTDEEIDGTIPEEAAAPAERPTDALAFWREEVLRRAAQALQGRVVILWEVTSGAVAPILVSQHRPLPPTAAAEFNTALRSWGVPLPDGSRWIACRMDMGRWCIAPVRSDIPPPPPDGMERRRKERMALELAGLCLGLLHERFPEG